MIGDEELTLGEVGALLAAGDGKDIFCPTTAAFLRRLSKTHPHLLLVATPMGKYELHDPRPCLWARTTKLGREAIHEWRKE